MPEPPQRLSIKGSEVLFLSMSELLTVSLKPKKAATLV